MTDDTHWGQCWGGADTPDERDREPSDDIIDYDPQDYPEAVAWAKERAKELRRQSERIAILNTTNANLHSHIRDLEAENKRLQVCSNCKHISNSGGTWHCGIGRLPQSFPTWACIWNPSRWKARP